MEKELMEKKNDLIVRAEEVLNKAKQETRELTEDETNELIKIRDDIRSIVKTLELKGDFDKMEVVQEAPKPEVAKEEIEVRAFENYVRGIVTRDSNLTETDNGAVIPETIANKIIKRVYDICPILEKSTKYNVKGTLTIPYYDETETAITVAYQDEFSALHSNIGKFTNITLTGYLAGALSLVSRNLINNAQFDIVSFVVNEMAYHIARFIEHELLNGTNQKVTGLSTLTNSLTAASANAITSNELIELQAKIKDVYQNNAIWIMSPATRLALRELKDNTGRYLLQDDITSPFGHSLLGKPVYVTDNMANLGAGNTAIFYGDMSGLATKFNEEINIQILRERYADQHAVGVIGWLNFDAKVEDAQKIAKLVCASSN